MNTIGSVTIWRCIVLNLIIIITSPAKQADRMKVKHNINIIQKEILLLQNEIIYFSEISNVNPVKVT